ncbi:methylated-DNA-[protein]-cysteine S-methyltransferase [Tieghemostelium lacteum]|uniref:Methylated-DNA--protein-cysteine methyltransferase n=1 Tax=Tieghemostelium lacteum TaxID=361077 RepID=A0A152A7N4_TIELA|nr:methylated-DNA-[protein]-cysteine S-methyltransferase [Tieghemostelium lacteum]|eukprot:KYR02135.1 methylated-DNA-[protein]-cysteine S-methyltransferase [Tieghemostelium lacteum]
MSKRQRDSDKNPSQKKKFKETQIYFDQFETGIGVIGFYSNEKELLQIEIDSTDDKSLYKCNIITNQFKKELERYFGGLFDENEWFKTPIDYKQGSEFQQAVWKQMLKIPYGKTTSYGTMAKEMGYTSCYSRAIASACRLNKFPIIIPCHRVVSSTGEIVGYMGKHGISKQKFLFNLETTPLSTPKKEIDT